MLEHLIKLFSNLRTASYFTILACMLSIIGLSCQGMELIEDDIEMVVETWCAPNQQVEVIRVYDGDTFMYIDENGEEQSIRMLGVAAPEVASGDEPAECFGDASAEFLRNLIIGQEVELQFDRECTDMFQRTLSWAILRGDDPQVAGWLQEVEMVGLESDGSYEFLINELLVQLGYAEVFRGEVDASERYSEQMEIAEDNAELRQLGLWNACP